MLKETITYKDYNDTERTEDFYFNYSEIELYKMEASDEGGLSDRLKKIINAKDWGDALTMFEKIVLGAYGEKSPDGRKFLKSEEISNSFASSNAYTNLFLKLTSDTEAMSRFVNGILPSNYAAAMNEMDNSAKLSVVNN